MELVWYIDPKTRTATVYTAPDKSSFIDRDACCPGGEVLPGFALPLQELFERAGPPMAKDE